ncbi:protein FAM186A isoform X2 [Mixophyes fleayi]|uniref:protein FAM186A isoform X2 n=1 Tax=Mixophyes fleayi TaxID=3061075 RepID=UPI003F4D8663
MQSLGSQKASQKHETHGNVQSKITTVLHERDQVVNIFASPFLQVSTRSFGHQSHSKIPGDTKHEDIIESQIEEEKLGHSIQDTIHLTENEFIKLQPIPTVQEHYEQTVPLAAVQKHHIQTVAIPTVQDRYVQTVNIPTVQEHYVQTMPVPTVQENYVQTVPIPTVQENYAQTVPIPTVHDHYKQTVPIPTMQEHYEQTVPIPTVQDHYEQTVPIPTVQDHYEQTVPIPTVQDHYEQTVSIPTVQEHYEQTVSIPTVQDHYEQTVSIPTVQEHYEQTVSIPTVQDHYEQTVSIPTVQEHYEQTVSIPKVQDHYEQTVPIPTVQDHYEQTVPIATVQEHYEQTVPIPTQDYYEQTVPIPTQDHYEQTVPIPTVQEHYEQTVPIPKGQDHYEQTVPIPTVQEHYEQTVPIPTVQDRYVQTMPIPTVQEHYEQTVPIPTGQDHYEQTVPIPTVQEHYEQTVPIPTVQEHYEQTLPIPTVQDQYEQAMPIPTEQDHYEQAMPIPTGQDHYEQAMPIPTVQDHYEQTVPIPTVQEHCEQTVPIPTVQDRYVQTMPIPTVQDHYEQAMPIPTVQEDYEQTVPIPTVQEHHDKTVIIPTVQEQPMTAVLYPSEQASTDKTDTGRAGEAFPQDINYLLDQKSASIDLTQKMIQKKETFQHLDPDSQGLYKVTETKIDDTMLKVKEGTLQGTSLRNMKQEPSDAEAMVFVSELKELHISHLQPEALTKMFTKDKYVQTGQSDIQHSEHPQSSIHFTKDGGSQEQYSQPDDYKDKNEFLRGETFPKRLLKELVFPGDIKSGGTEKKYTDAIMDRHPAGRRDIYEEDEEDMDLIYKHTPAKQIFDKDPPQYSKEDHFYPKHLVHDLKSQSEKLVLSSPEALRTKQSPRQRIVLSAENGEEDEQYYIDVRAQRTNLDILKKAKLKRIISPQLQSHATDLILQAFEMDLTRLGNLFRKYTSSQMIQKVRENLISRLSRATQLGKEHERENLCVFLRKLDEYHRKILQRWTNRQTCIEQERNKCLSTMFLLFKKKTYPWKKGSNLEDRSSQQQFPS